jgi:hypothetical protein
VESLVVLNHDDASGDYSRLFQGLASEMNSVEKDALLQPTCRRNRMPCRRQQFMSAISLCHTSRPLQRPRVWWDHRSWSSLPNMSRHDRCEIGPHLRKPNLTGLQCASASSLRQFGPVSSEALVAVLVILDPDAAEWHPGTNNASPATFARTEPF